MYFKKISGEKIGKLTPDMKIDSSLAIKELSKEGTEELPFLKFLFNFTVSYSEAGKLNFEAHIIFADKKEEIETLYKNYQKNKDLPTELKTALYNHALYKCSLRALSLSEDLGLPAHIKFPYVESKK